MVEKPTVASKIFDIFNLIFLLLITLVCILPIWYILMLSMSDKLAVSSGAVGLWPVGFNLKSYTEILKDSRFWTSFWNSIMRVILGGVIGILAIVLTAFPLSRTKAEFPRRNFFMWVLIICMLFSGGLVPWYLNIKNLGLLDSIWALVFGGGLQVFNVILVVNFFRNLPKELEEAAWVDGAEPIYILFKLFIPLSLPVIATVSLFTVVYHWNEYFQGLVLMSRSEHYPLQTYIQQLVVPASAENLTEEQMLAMATLSNEALNAAKVFIAMIPVLIIYPFAQKYFVHGITLGSVKG